MAISPVRVVDITHNIDTCQRNCHPPGPVLSAKIFRTAAVHGLMRKNKGGRVWPEDFKAARHRAGFSVTKCAEFLHVTTRTVQNWEAGRCAIPWSAYLLVDRGVIWPGWRMSAGFLWQEGGYTYEPGDLMQLDQLKNWYRLTTNGEYIAGLVEARLANDDWLQVRRVTAPGAKIR